MEKKMIFPKICSLCGKNHKGIRAVCSDCTEKINKYSHGNKCIKCNRSLDNEIIGICRCCKKVKPQFDIATAVFPYGNNFRQAIIDLKFNFEYYRIAGMAELMYEYFLKLNLRADCAVYVPSDIKAYYRRRYCLSQELAYGLAKKLNIPVYKGSLIKKPGTAQQSLIDFEKRYTNVKGAFIKNIFSVGNVKNKAVLLVDDVITTGSTISECAGILKKSGAEKVFAAALAYGASD